MTDNSAILAGYTREIVGEGSLTPLYLLVRPETDLGRCFKAWDQDGQEFVIVNGWLYSFDDVKCNA